MIRNLKVLGLAVVAMLAMSAVGVSSASGQVQDLATSAVQETFLTATSGDNIYSITSPVQEFKCTTTQLSGVVKGASATEGTVTPTYAGTLNVIPHTTHCTSSLGQITVDMNSCDYILTGKTDAKHNGKSNTHAQVHVVCSKPEDHITVTNGLCTFRVPAQTPTEGGLTFKNEGSPSYVHVTATVTGITYTTHGGFCALGGLPTHGNNSDYTGTAIIKGYSDSAHGSQVSIQVSS